MRKLHVVAAAGCAAFFILAGLLSTQVKAAPNEKSPSAWTDASGLFNAAQSGLGASATGSGAPFNKDLPASEAIRPEGSGGIGTVFGGPLTKGRVDIKLAAPVEIKAIETIGLDYHETQQPKAIDIFVDGKMVQHVDLPETPGKAVRIPLEAKGQVVGILVTDEYPRRKAADGGQGPNWGGWDRIRVLTPDNLASLMTVPAGYHTVAAADNLMPTSGVAAEGKVEVFGEPRTTQGHPNTLWDQQDIEHYKKMLQSSKELQEQFAALRKAMDLRLSRPLTVPAPQKDAKGQWRHISDQENNTGKVHDELSLDIANLGTMYALSGEEKYADYAKKLLLAYADVFANYVPGNRPGFAHDEGMLFDQRLGDATWLIQVARGYDLIYNLPSITAAERKHIQDDLLKASAWFIAGNHAMLEAPTNWSAIATASILITGYATDDAGLLSTAMYGLKGTKEKPTGGLYLHFSDQSISDDGLWSEGSTGYQFMAMEALITDAEILWHHGIDMYRYRDAALKHLFDSPLRYAYANQQTPAISDGGGGSIIASESNLWEYGYLRYHDPQYFLILNQATKNLRAEFQKWPVSVLYDVAAGGGENAKPPEWKSVNFFSVGFGILRLPDDPAMCDLTFLYGKAHSHGHPDKLSFDLYALGDRFMFDPGSVWYELPLYRQWYHTTLAHNTLVVDGHDQAMCGATLLTYGAARTMGLERATTDEAYPGVTMDRSLFMTPNYVADIFGAFAQIPHTMDLAWHVNGEMKSTLKLEPFAAQSPLPNGYDALTNLQHATTADAWSAEIKTKKGVGRFFAAPAVGGSPTEILIGEGHYGRDHPPAIIERRAETKSAIYGNVADISNAKDGYVRSATLEGDLEKGYALLTVKTAQGEDLCFTSFRPGTYKVGDLETDAQQAFVRREGKQVVAMYLAGGTELKIGDTGLKPVHPAGNTELTDGHASLRRKEAGLAYIERVESGNWLLGNPSPKASEISEAVAGIEGTQAFQLGGQVGAAGDRIGILGLTGENYYRGVVLQPLTQVELAKPGAPSVHDASQTAAQKRQRVRDAELAKARGEAAARSKTRREEAAAKPAPANTVIVVQAEDFSAQGEGEAKSVDNKTATIGKAIMGFDGDGQWLEWTVDAPAEGWYNLTACYCTPLPSITREISVNGTVQEPLAPLLLPPTGGWANGADDWKLAAAMDPATGKSLLIKFNKGKNTLRLTNIDGGGSNLDYLLITSPDVAPAREMAAKGGK